MRKVRLLFAAALAIPVALVGPSAAHAAVAGTPPCNVAPQREATAAAAVAATTTVWLAGDSTMANPSSGATCPVGWGAQFGSLFNSNVVVKNLAIGGRSIQTWMYATVNSTKDSSGECTVSSAASANWQNVQTNIKAGDYLFIQFGINDSTSACPRHVGTARYQSLMTTMANFAKSKGAFPILLTAVAAITCSGSTAAKNRGFVAETTAAGTATGSPVIDLQTLSVNYYNSVGLCPNNSDYTSGLVGQLFCNDHTHFEAYGALQIAKLVAGALKTQNIPLAASLL